MTRPPWEPPAAEQAAGAGGPVGASWTFEESRRRCRVAAMAQRAAERALKHAARASAEAEEAYRKALALEIVRQHDEEKVAWTVAPDLARGNEDVAGLRRERDIAEGVREAQQQVAWRRAADRKDAQRFADYSLRKDLMENGPGGDVHPMWTQEAAA